MSEDENKEAQEKDLEHKHEEGQDQEQEQDKEQEKPAKWPLYLTLGIVAAGILLYWLEPSVQDFFREAWEVLTSEDEERIKKWVDQFGWWGPLVIVLAMTAQIFLLVIPTPLLMLVAILAYGPWLGSAIILVAVAFASSFAYMLGYYLGVSLVTKLIGAKEEQKVGGIVREYGFWAVVVFRLSPFLSNDAISIVSGMLQMGYWRFIGATMLGIFPLTAALAFLGENNERLRQGLIWLSVISLVGFIAYVWWDRRRNKK